MTQPLFVTRNRTQRCRRACGADTWWGRLCWSAAPERANAAAVPATVGHEETYLRCLTELVTSGWSVSMQSAIGSKSDGERESAILGWPATSCGGGWPESSVASQTDAKPCECEEKTKIDFGTNNTGTKYDDVQEIVFFKQGARSFRMITRRAPRKARSRMKYSTT
ncbi:hypothetical protein KCP73_21755 [Salmonella enterica subsp. enterica]|nr:hypothetical protein KCP73_21755 [Salmonella enterica subsp. enterica]